MTIVRPTGIECTKWEPISQGSKRCRYYIDPGELQEEGMCKLPSELLCVEWVRKNGTSDQKRELLGRQPPPQPGRGPFQEAAADPPPLVLAAQDPLPPRPPPTRPPGRLRTASGDVLLAPPQPFEPAKEIDPASLETLERAGVEVELSAPHLDGGITLVPARTGRTDRSELTYRECATIRLIVDAFPGSYVTAYRSGVPRTTAEQAGVSEEAYAAEMAIGTGGPDDPMLEEDPFS